MSSPFSLRLYVQDVGRADAFDKCAIPKTNGYDNRQSTAQLFEVKSSVAAIQNLISDVKKLSFWRSKARLLESKS